MTMNKKQYIVAGLLLAASVLMVSRTLYKSSVPEKDDMENEEQEARYTEMRARYDYDMIKDPVTGRIPGDIYRQELEAARAIPQRGDDISARTTALNTYYPAGPNNQGGRTRAVAYDVRYNGSSNKVIIAGGVSGGIFRSADAGATWTRVSPDNEIHNVSCIVQDPRAGNQDTWYAGGGEPWGNSAGDLGATYLGYGLYKSVNNGVTWTRLPMNTITDISGGILGVGTLETFDHPFDYVHKLFVDPANGNLYVAGHRRLMRSTDGGQNFNVVFGGSTGAIAAGGQMDIVKAGSTFVLAVNGGFPDLNLRGVWTSTTGNLNGWTRIAGGSTIGTDSVGSWRGNSYRFYTSTSTYLPKRIILAAAPSNSNIVYVCYENGLSNTSPDNAPEVDMYKLDLSAGVNWTNLSANMPDFNGSTNNAATDPITTQGGYDLCLAVKPDNANFVLLGGTSLYRSTDGFATTGNTSWIGGYGNTLPVLTFYSGSHPDIHALAFNPSSPNEMICGNDGGIQQTLNITTAGSNVLWNNINNYQTLQYYYVAIDPTTGANNFIGGAQDNGTYLRDKTGITGTAAVDSNNHRKLFSGDGVSVGFGKINGTDQYVYCGFQLGNIRRAKVVSGLGSGNFSTITPSGLTTDGNSGEWGEFVTNFKLDPDNTEDLYYVNYNRLFRTTAASTVTSGTWTEMTGIGSAVNPSNPSAGTNIGIRALGFSRGPYTTSHALFIGTTNGKVFRLNDPRNALASAAPVDITPSGLPAGANVQDIAVNPNNDDEIMLVVTNYTVNSAAVTSIWWTNNAKSGAPTWKNAEGNLSLPSIRSCAIITKKDASNNPVTEYYVGTSVGLYSATDIGTTLTAGGSVTWAREGGSVLNYAVIQSLSYRPADNVLLVGTHGNGMYYTFLGTPNFNPNQNTATIDPTINSKTFIKLVFPTVSRDLVKFNIGNQTGIQKIRIDVLTMNGQQVYSRTASYQDGSVDLSRMSPGIYILSIFSDNGRYRHLQKIVKP